MNSRSQSSPALDPPQSKKPLGKKGAGSLVVLVLVALYTFAQPRLNDRFGWNLPGWKQNAPAEVQSQSGAETSVQPADAFPDDADTLASDTAAKDQPAPPAALDERMKPSGSTPGKAGNKGPPAETAEPTEELLFGLLREVSHDRFISPQGLQYLPGSAEGHRLEHLRRHIKDQPSRPGKHGVFEGGMEGALATIDQAYERAKKNQRTTKQVDRDRTIYTVDMGRRVGYVGGRDGNRQNKPMARRVKLVLEGNQVITAYPL